MKLNEVLDKPLPWKWKKQGAADEYWATFWTDMKNPTPATGFSVEMNLGEVGEWAVSFGDGRGRMGITKGGNEFKIFATVVDIIKEFIRLEKPNEIQFDAKEGNRAKLYMKMIKKFAPKLGYKLYHKGRDEGGNTGFSLRRK